MRTRRVRLISNEDSYYNKNHEKKMAEKSFTAVRVMRNTGYKSSEKYSDAGIVGGGIRFETDANVF